MAIVTVKLWLVALLINDVLVNSYRESWEGKGVASAERATLGVIFLEGIDGVVCHVHLEPIPPVVVQVSHVDQHLSHSGLNEGPVT